MKIDSYISGFFMISATTLLSILGLLIVRKALEQGSNIQVSIQPPDDGAPVVCALEVIWCAASGAAYLVGGRFQNRLSDDEMSRLI